MKTAVLTIAALAVVGVTVPSSAHAVTTCAYAGPPANRLTVTVTGGSIAVLERRGAEIFAGDSERSRKPCGGGTPTVTNTDTIAVRFSGSVAFGELHLDKGPFAPGASPESEGAPEIEIQLSGTGAGFSAIGTPGDDVFRWGAGATHAGLNLNPSDAGDQDLDVTVTGGASAPLLIAEGNAGDDTITGDPIELLGVVTAAGGSGDDIITAPGGKVAAFFEGGPGDDVITGSARNDVLRGDAGRDRIAGGAGADNITGGAGADRIAGGVGGDFIKVRDDARDSVSCGAGRDRVNTDRRDVVNGCERINRR